MGGAHLESTTIRRLESRQNPHAGKRALRSLSRLYLFSVAQIANLPYRRLQIGTALAVFRRPGQGAVLQDGILRYSAARPSRNQSSADWESAVSRIGNPQGSADCQSAKQQIDNLRYEKSSRGATISADTDRLAVCATNTTEALNRYPQRRLQGFIAFLAGLLGPVHAPQAADRDWPVYLGDKSSTHFSTL